MWILKKQLSDQFNYKTIDIAKDLNPDILGSVDKMPIKNDSFDLVCAFQVLEHLPFDKFEDSLKEMARVTKKNALISLPHCNITSKLSIKLPLLPHLKTSLIIPRFYKKFKFDGEHYWEIGAKDYPLKRIKAIMAKHFIIKKVFSPFENKYHVFFVLEKRS